MQRLHVKLVVIGVLCVLAVSAFATGNFLEIKANGSVADLTLSSYNTLNVTVGVNAGDYAGLPVDWWCLAKSDGVWYHYDLMSGFVPGVRVSHTGALQSLAGYSVLSTDRLPPGTYDFYFGIDTVPNGQINLESLIYRSVTVKILSADDTLGQLELVVRSHLRLIKDAVAAIVNPDTHAPTQFPLFDQLYAAAGRIKSSPNPAKHMATILALLGRASDFGREAPTADYALQFPVDHHLHPAMGFEWYYLCAHLDVTDPQGASGRIGILLSMQKQNIVGQLTQQQYGISDINNMLFVNLVTATVDFPNHKKITRRSENLQLPVAGGSAGFSVPGQDFNFTVGTDSLVGTDNVLPLVVSVGDNDNLSFSFTLTALDGITLAKAFFLQGEPNSQLTGTGITLAPRPGIYYSWPQLDVDATPSPEITVDGVAYTINGGKGWIDHQIMMTSLKNRDDKVFPIPYTDDPRPFNGWSWMFVNLDNGNAFTVAAFQEGDFNTEPIIPYGYYLSPDLESGQWNSQYIIGQMRMENFRSFPVIVDDPSSPAVLFPTAWQLLLQNMSGDSMAGDARPWIHDGTFNGQSLQVISEHPIDYRDIYGNHGNGISESVGFEDVESYMQRALDYLVSN